MSEKFPAIPMPTPAPEALLRSAMAIKEAVEMLTGARGAPNALRLLAAQIERDLGYAYVPEAPTDGVEYARQDGGWVPVTTPPSGIPEAPIDGTSYVREDAGWVSLPAPGIADAPIDGVEYVRKDGAWEPLLTDLGDDVLAFEFGDSAPVASQVLSLILVHDISIPNNFTGSRGSVTSNPVSNLVVTVKVDATTLGTITVNTAGVFTFAFSSPGSPYAATAGQRVSLTMPGSIPAGTLGFCASLLTDRTS